MTADTATTFRLHTKTGRSAFIKAIEDDSGIDVSGIRSIERYIDTNVPGLIYKNYIIVYEDDSGAYFVIKNNVIFEMASLRLDHLQEDHLPRVIHRALEEFPVGVIAPHAPSSDNGSASKFIIQNGDEESNAFVARLESYSFPTISFRCLGRFYDNDVRKGVKKAVAKLATGEIQILDFWADESIRFTPKELAQFERLRYSPSKIVKSVSPPEPPKPGFTALTNAWHRASTVLLRDSQNEMTMLLGMDESDYFGCELQDSPTTVVSAFESLVPEDLRHLGPLTRQGEWFFVPIKESDVPEVTDCLFYTSDFQLPLDHPEGNYHEVTCSEGRVAKDGVIYALDPRMAHREHTSVTRYGWYTFRRNTAKRSYSEEGVD